MVGGKQGLREVRKGIIEMIELISFGSIKLTCKVILIKVL